MMEQRASVAAFTGHRTYRREADASLRAAIRTLYAEGVRTFLSGMAIGFDLAAAEVVLACRPACPGLRLAAVVPFRGQADRFPPAEQARFEAVLAAADERIILSERYHTGVYAVRNDYLVDHASVLISWYDGRPGGTRYTVERARHKGLRLIHLHPATPSALRCAMPELF